jgi:predicted ATPase with chaperone activity
MPGELSLAHPSVLLLHELSEFRQYVVEAMRRPIEESLTGIQSPARARPQLLR